MVDWNFNIVFLLGSEATLQLGCIRKSLFYEKLVGSSIEASRGKLDEIKGLSRPSTFNFSSKKIG